MIGLALLVIQFEHAQLTMILFMIPVVLLARYISVALPYSVFRRFRDYNKYSVRILSWGGLRGALSLAMAVSIPAGIMLDENGPRGLRNLMVTMTYVIVLFSIIVQGATVAPLINRAKRAEKETTP